MRLRPLTLLPVRRAGRLALLALWTGFCLGLSANAFGGQSSDLWGANGERWAPASRLPDFSFAGYHCGEAPLPNVAPGVSIKQFGAKGDGIADDTQAFLRALAEVKTGAIEIPPGRYMITKILEITRPGLVLRGAGTDKTCLFCPTTLNQVRPNWGATTTGERTSNYSWSGGFVWFKGSNRSRLLATVTGPAQRGDTSLPVSATDTLRVGQRIEISLSEAADKWLTAELYSGDTGDTQKLRSVRASLVTRVTRVEGGRVYFDRPLRWNLKLAWRPRIQSFDPSVTEAGLEHLCFEFPDTPYRGHFTELGFNAVALNEVADCWVRDLRIVNADSGLFPLGRFCTIQGVVFESARQTEAERGATGHHGINFENDDNLLLDFDFRTKFMHDITVARCAGNVCAHGQGVDLCFDHHKYAPYENLFTDIDVGLGTRPWQCGGGALGEKHRRPRALLEPPLSPSPHLPAGVFRAGHDEPGRDARRWPGGQGRQWQVVRDHRPRRPGPARSSCRPTGATAGREEVAAEGPWVQTARPRSSSSRWVLIRADSKITGRPLPGCVPPPTRYMRSNSSNRFRGRRCSICEKLWARLNVAPR